MKTGKGDISRTVRHRALTRAARAWQAGRPHTAWEILADAGLAAYWPTFRRTALSRARSRYLREMSRYA